MQPDEKWPPYSTENRGVTSLILGILGVTVCGVFSGLPAWLVARNYLREVEEGTANPKEQGLAKVAEVLGAVSTFLGTIMIVWAAFSFYNRIQEGRITDENETSAQQIIRSVEARQRQVASATARQKEIADAVVKYKRLHPEMTYPAIAKQLSQHAGKTVEWCTAPLTTSRECGDLSFKATKDSLVLLDSCSSTTLGGWPPTQRSLHSK